MHWRQAKGIHTGKALFVEQIDVGLGGQQLVSDQGLTKLDSRHHPCRVRRGVYDDFLADHGDVVELCQGRRESVPAGRSKTVPLNAQHEYRKSRGLLKLGPSPLADAG